MANRPLEPILALRRRLERPWRLAFVVYAIALTVATHWPRLRLPGEVPVTDKTIHFLVFGGLTWLLWRTGWVRRLRWLLVVTLVWSVVDEVSQSLPILNRFVTWEDLVANGLGVVTVVVLLWSLAPLGGPVNRRRHALHGYAFGALFAQPRTWLVFGSITVLCVVPVLVARFMLPTAEVRPIVIVTTLVWLHAGALTLVFMWRAARLEAARRCACFECGMYAAAPPAPILPAPKCVTCGATLDPGQWSNPPRPPAVEQIRLAVWPIVAVTLVVGAVFGALLVSHRVYAALIDTSVTQAPATRAARLLGTLPPSLGRTVDLALFVLLIAVATRVYRVRLARYYDRAIRCRRCGHDLSRTPTDDGRGRCGECGYEFEATERSS